MKKSDCDSLSSDVFGAVVFSYSRSQAIDDGVLVDVSTLAREAGFKWPVAITESAWSDCVAWSDRDNQQQLYQDESGRLWDVLVMASQAVRTASGSGDRLLFSLLRVPRDGRTQTAKPVTLKLMIGPGDTAEPVITLMLPNED